MNAINDLAQSKSIWQPQFLEKINQYVCLDCDRFDEVGGSNAMGVKSVNQNDGTNSQDRIIGIVNPEQCANCTACTGNHTEKSSTHYSFLYESN